MLHGLVPRHVTFTDGPVGIGKCGAVRCAVRIAKRINKRIASYLMGGIGARLEYGAGGLHDVKWCGSRPYVSRNVKRMEAFTARGVENVDTGAPCVPFNVW